MQAEVLEGYRLSIQQARLWRTLGDPRVRHAIVLRLRGSLDCARLRAAIAAAVARHEMLRATFHTLPGMPAPLQMVSPDAGDRYLHVDLATTPAPPASPASSASHEGWPSSRETSREAPAGAMDWAPEWRLCRVSGAEHTLRISAPAMTVDAASLRLIAEEIGRDYAGVPAAEDPRQAVLQYIDVAEWQHATLDSEAGARAAKSWQHYFARLDAGTAPIVPPDLSSAHRRAAPSATGRHAAHATHAARATAVLTGIPARPDEPLWLAALWSAWLWRITHAEPMVLAFHDAGRPMPELTTVVGPLETALGVVVEMQSRWSIAELVHAVGDVVTRARDQQVYLMAADLPRRAIGFSHRVWPRAARHGGLDFDVIHEDIEDIRSASSPMSLDVVRRGGRVSLTVTADPATYPADAIAAVADSFATFVRAASRASAAARITELPLLPAAARQLTRAWERGAAARSKISWWSEGLEAQARRQPNAIAVECGADTCTFAALNRHANQLARVLRRQGVGPEHRVGLLLERSVAQLVALFAVLKAGAAYVPLDPQQPAARLQAVLAATGVGTVITMAAMRASLADWYGARCFLDREAAALDEESSADLGPRATPQNLAYVLATSGSTGAPKAVGVTYGNLAHLRAALTRALGPRPGPRRVSLNGALSFDTSVKQWLQVLDGHTVCVVPEAARSDVAAWRTWVEESGVHVLDGTPAHVQALPAAASFAPALAQVLIGGEAIPAAAWTAWADAPWAAYNLYGPTECTVDATVARIAGAAPHLGRPLANTQVYVCDARGERVPIGVAGELWIGGGGVARGYAGQAGLTAARFVPDAYGAVPGARLYRTGDRARWRADGRLEFLGRLDHQVKLRGYRIELGEIEAALASAPGVQQAVAVLRDDPPAGPQLVAYVLPARDATVSPALVHAHLAARVPAYMLPATIVPVAVWPLTPNGKIDRRALPAPATTRDPDDETPARPRTAVEEIVAGIWTAVLPPGREVGRDTHFFERGGHSLLATQVMARVRQAFGADVPLRALFEAPTVAGLAAHIETARHAMQTAVRPPLRAGARPSRLALSFAQLRVWLAWQLDPASAAYNSPVALRVDGPLDIAALRHALTTVTTRHESLRTHFAASDGTPEQCIAPPEPLPLPVVDLSAVSAPHGNARARRLARDEARRPFDLARGPVMRAALIRCAPSDHVLLVTLHHIACDGWSLEILLREFSEAYRAYHDRRPVRLPALPVQYADFASWQRAWLDGRALDAQIDYWRDRLAHVPLLDLPADRLRPPAPSHRGGRLPFTLTDAVSEGLRELSRREGVTLFMTLLAAFDVVLARYSGQTDICVGAPIANRTHVETEGLIGFFVNTLLLRTTLDADATFRALLARVREIVLQASDHQDAPFERVLEACGLSERAGRGDVPRVMFELDAGRSILGLTLPDVRVSSVWDDDIEAKWDVTVLVSDTRPTITGAVIYARDLFDEATADGLRALYEDVLSEIVANPDAAWQTLGAGAVTTDLAEHFSAPIES